MKKKISCQNAPPVSYMGYDDQHPPAHTPGAISERGPATPWNHEDYEFPPSVGPVFITIYQKKKFFFQCIIIFACKFIARRTANG